MTFYVTPRQYEILLLASQGQPYRFIQKDLGITVRTIDATLTYIRKRFKIADAQSLKKCLDKIKPKYKYFHSVYKIRIAEECIRQGKVVHPTAIAQINICTEIQAIRYYNSLGVKWNTV